MKIQSLQLKNYRCFEDIRITFHDQLTVIVGTNGSGKTAILDAVNIFLEEIATQLQEKNENSYWRKWTLDQDNLRINGSTEAKGTKSTVGMSLSLSEPINKNLQWEFFSRRQSDELMEEKYSPDSDFSQVCAAAKSASCMPIFRYFLADRHCCIAKISTDANFATDRDNAYENISAEHFQNTGSASWIYNLVARMAFSKVDGTTETYVPEYEAAKKAFVRALSPEGAHKPIYEKLGITFDARNSPYLAVYRVNDNTPYKVSQLSQGYQSMLSLILELAWRMGITNPGKQEDILESPGIFSLMK